MKDDLEIDAFIVCFFSNKNRRVWFRETLSIYPSAKLVNAQQNTNES